MVKRIEESELIRAFQEAYARHEDVGYLTSEEWAEELRAGKERTLRYLRRMKAIGRIDVGDKEILSLDNKRLVVPAYKLLKTPLEE